MKSDELPWYAAVYVVSDLHLGGFEKDGRNYRIFRETKELAWFVRSLIPVENTNEPAHRPVALVLNGDIVDFLADEAATYFDWRNARAKLVSAVTDPEQGDVWVAMKEFVRSGAGDLVLVLGNHDLELALPDPQAYLLDFLSGGIAEHRGRVVFALDGSGFSCAVGGTLNANGKRTGTKRVLCVHGNEADPWNVTDYGRLSLIRRALARGSIQRNRAVLADWIPNPGTQMVIDYMNGIKRQYQWVDLLKPEEEAAAMVTASIADSPKLRLLAELVVKKTLNARKMAKGFLGGDAEWQVEAEDPAALVTGTTRRLDPDDLVRETLDHLGRGVRPLDLVDGDAEFLMGVAELVVTSQALKKWPRALRDVLRASLASDKTFDIRAHDDVFSELDALCAPDVDFLVAGHTHLARALPRGKGHGYYFNSGTWIRIMHIPLELLDDPYFREVEERLRDGSMELLAAKIGDYPDGLLRTTRTVVKIEPDGATVRGRLMNVVSKRKTWALEPVAGSVLPKVPS